MIFVSYFHSHPFTDRYCSVETSKTWSKLKVLTVGNILLKKKKKKVESPLVKTVYIFYNMKGKAKN